MYRQDSQITLAFSTNSQGTTFFSKCLVEIIAYHLEYIYIYIYKLYIHTHKYDVV